MNTKDLIVILLILSIILWAAFHQMASKYINNNDFFKKIHNGSVYKIKSMDVANIELVITMVTFINFINYFSEKSLENFFKKREFLIFNNVNLETSINIINNHKKLWFYIKVSLFFMVLIIFFTILFWIY
ncbi:hypothetical protein [Acinetobacter sp. YH12126]|uniref:hypothetical protein n=1 Tax=Acinetobacter sp. YH12126 TaxID=2601111 RepID=UPI0015D2BBDC|nr:hypothetical protein [Acinetobacter sp. YH12126]